MLHRQAGVRIGLLIADDQMMVFSPTPRLIEAGPKQPSQPIAVHKEDSLSQSAGAAQQTMQPNAVLLGTPPPTIVAELGRGPEGVKAQKVGLDKADLATIAEVKTELKENPPLSFDIAQKVRVFNAYFEFVDLSLESVLIQKRSVNLPPDLAKFTTDEELNKAIKTSVGLIGDHPGLSGEALKAECDELRKKFLVVLRGYKPVVLRKNKAGFEAEVETLRVKVAEFGQKQQQELQKAIDATRDRLTDQIMPKIAEAPPGRWHKAIGPKPSRADVEDMLRGELSEVLGDAAQIVSKMRVKLLFMGVTFESLNDPEFIKVAQKALPGLKRFHDEYDAAKGKDKGGLFGGKP